MIYCLAFLIFPLKSEHILHLDYSPFLENYYKRSSTVINASPKIHLHNKNVIQGLIIEVKLGLYKHLENRQEIF